MPIWRIVASALLVCVGTAIAADRYDYDAAGRLIRSVDAENRVTTYRYDASGNVLSVMTGGVLVAPLVSSVSPSTIRQNEVRQIAITGQGLIGLSARSESAEIDVSGLIESEDALTLTLSVSRHAPVGTHRILLTNAIGTVAVEMDVRPAERFVVQPTVIQVPPNSVFKTIAFSIEEPRAEALVFAVQVAHGSVAGVNAATFTIEPGQTMGSFSVRGFSDGNTFVRISNTTLRSALETVVLVRNGFNYSASRPVGVVRGLPVPVSSSRQKFSASVGVVRGSPIPEVSFRQTFGAAIGVVRGSPVPTPSTSTATSSAVGIVVGETQ